MYFKGFGRIFHDVIRARSTPSARVRLRAGRGLFRAGFAALGLGAVAGCRENLSVPPPTGSGPDTSGPQVRLSPAADTLVDSTGTLLVRVSASDRSGIRRIEFTITPPTSTFAPIDPADTAFDAFYPIQLATYKHSVFTYVVRAVDILDHETVTRAVAVTVR